MSGDSQAVTQPTALMEGLTDSVKVLCTDHHKTGHFGDILNSQSLGTQYKTSKH